MSKCGSTRAPQSPGPSWGTLPTSLQCAHVTQALQHSPQPTEVPGPCLLPLKGLLVSLSVLWTPLAQPTLRSCPHVCPCAPHTLQEGHTTAPQLKPGLVCVPVFCPFSIPATSFPPALISPSFLVALLLAHFPSLLPPSVQASFPKPPCFGHLPSFGNVFGTVSFPPLSSDLCCRTVQISPDSTLGTD